MSSPSDDDYDMDAFDEALAKSLVPSTATGGDDKGEKQGNNGDSTTGETKRPMLVLPGGAREELETFLLESANGGHGDADKGPKTDHDAGKPTSNNEPQPNSTLNRNTVASNGSQKSQGKKQVSTGNKKQHHKSISHDSVVVKAGSSLMFARAIYSCPLPGSQGMAPRPHTRHRSRASLDKGSAAPSSGQHSPTFGAQLDSIDAVYGLMPHKRHTKSRQASLSPTRSTNVHRVTESSGDGHGPTLPSTSATSHNTNNTGVTPPSTSTPTSPHNNTPKRTNGYLRLPGSNTRPTVPSHTPSSSPNPFHLSPSDAVHFRRSEGEHKALMNAWLTPVPTASSSGGNSGNTRLSNGSTTTTVAVTVKSM